MKNLHMKKGDKIVGIILLIVVIISLSATAIYKNAIKGTQNIAVIKRDGTVLKTIDLNKAVEPQEFTIKADNGNFNTILVKNNTIKIIDANCLHKECVKSGAISQPGQMIVCLPDRLIITVEGQASSGIDSTSF